MLRIGRKGEAFPLIGRHSRTNKLPTGNCIAAPTNLQQKIAQLHQQISNRKLHSRTNKPPTEKLHSRTNKPPTENCTAAPPTSDRKIAQPHQQTPTENRAAHKWATRDGHHSRKLTSGN
jgi:hypothetical protein